jgi:hypothetical protein
MPSRIERFFETYVAAFNRSLAGEVDSEGIRSHFASCFVAAGPDGVRCGENGDEFAETLRQGYAFYQSIGLESIAVREITTTPIDETHQMAIVEYRAIYEKPTGERVTIDFAVTYFLASRGERLEIFGFVAGDEMAAYRRHGLLPAGDTA